MKLYVSKLFDDGVTVGLEVDVDPSIATDRGSLAIVITRHTEMIIHGKEAADRKRGGSKPPDEDEPEHGGGKSSQPSTLHPSPSTLGLPRPGKQFFLWVKEKGMRTRAEEMGRARGYPWQLMSWQADQIADFIHELEVDAAGAWGTQKARSS